MATSQHAEVVGRERELEALSRFVDRLHRAPAALLLRGEPGIGKTTLWKRGAELAAGSGARVLFTRGVEAEMPLAFTALSDLLEPIADELDRLPAPQYGALAVALRRQEPDGPPPDRLALSWAVVAALRLRAAESPVVVAVDDAQWLDAPSRRVLAFALRRLGDHRVAVLAAVRGGQPDPLELRGAFGEPAFAELEIGPLSAGALSHLVRSRVPGQMSRWFLLRLHAASGGNPMFGLEFARAFTAQGVPQLSLPAIPSSLRELVRERLAAIPPALVPILELIAALDRPTPALLARALGDADEIERLLDSGIESGAILVGDDGVVRFTHPLVASAVYHDASPSRRRALHRQAAEIVEDDEQRARHLALGTLDPDARLAMMLEGAAGRAAGRGAPETAAELIGEAERVTPWAHADDRHRRTLSRAGYLIESGNVQGAQEALSPLLQTEVPADVRAQALIVRADCEFADRPHLVELLRQALDAAEGAPTLRWQALIRLAQHGGWVPGDAAAAAVYAADALAVAKRVGDASLVEQSELLLAYYEAARGRRRPTSGARSAPVGAGRPRLPAWHVAHASPGPALMWAGNLAEARAVFRRQYDELVRQGSVLKVPFLLVFMTELEWRAGDWPSAQRHADEAFGILGEAGPAGQMVVSYVRALMAASFGRVDEARAVATGAIERAKVNEDMVATIRNRWVLGMLDLSVGDPGRALMALEGLPEVLNDVGIREPGLYPVLPDVAEALVGLDRVAEAEGVVTQLETRAEELEHRWATPAAARCRGLVRLAAGDIAGALESLDAATLGFEASGHPLDRARSLLATGSALRRAGDRRAAVAILEDAKAVFDGLGARLWSERAGAELRHAGARPRADGELTMAEARVARLVASGLSNKEVAAQLFVSVATVEAHLTRIYRKLDVHSRAELARRVAEGSVALPDEQT